MPDVQAPKLSWLSEILKWFQFLNCDQGKENLKKELMQLHMLKGCVIE